MTRVIVAHVRAQTPRTHTRIYVGRAMQAAAGPLRQRLEAGENLALLCWCAPQPCHADVIRDWLEGGEK